MSIHRVDITFSDGSPKIIEVRQGPKGPSGASSPEGVLAALDAMDAGQQEMARDHIGAVASDDSRLSNSRPPTAHASTHASAGSDPIAPADIGAASSAELGLLAIDVGNQIAKDLAANNYGTVVTLTESRTLLSGDIGNTIDLAGFDLTMATGFVTAGDSVAIKGTGNVVIGGTPAPLDGSATLVLRYYATGWEAFSVSAAGVTSYNDLTDLPTLGSAAALNASTGGNGVPDAGKVAEFDSSGALSASAFVSAFALGSYATLGPGSLTLANSNGGQTLIFASADQLGVYSVSVPELTADSTFALTSDIPTTPEEIGAAADNAVVHLAGTEDITGNKTFTGGITNSGAFSFASGTTFSYGSGIATLHRAALSTPKHTNATSSPTNPADGDTWFNTETGATFRFYADGTSSQWVEVASTRIDNSSTTFSAGVPIQWAASAAATRTNLGLGASDTPSFSGATFTSTTRPTASEVTGNPSPTSLIRLADLSLSDIKINNALSDVYCDFSITGHSTSSTVSASSAAQAVTIATTAVAGSSGGRVIWFSQCSGSINYPESGWFTVRVTGNFSEDGAWIWVGNFAPTDTTNYSITSPHLINLAVNESRWFVQIRKKASVSKLEGRVVSRTSAGAYSETDWVELPGSNNTNESPLILALWIGGSSTTGGRITTAYAATSNPRSPTQWSDLSNATLIGSSPARTASYPAYLSAGFITPTGVAQTVAFRAPKFTYTPNP